MRSGGAHVGRHDLVPAALLRLAPDTRLVEAVNAGSERAFEALFHRHHVQVLAFCRQMLGSLDEAEDAAQLTFLAAYHDLARSECPKALRPWLYGIARHRCLSLLRARRERPVADVPEAPGDNLGAEVARRDELRGVLADLARLPQDQRAALILAELGDVSHEDIAGVLGCPRAKVKALVFQARSSLADAREARETPCAVIREQLSTLRGGALRRATLRRHVRDCPGCRAFRERLRIRHRLGLLLPVLPSVGLKRVVVGAVLGSGGGGAGGVAGGLAAAAIVTMSIPLAGITVATTGSRDDRGAATVRALAAERRGAPVGASPADVRLERVAAPEHRARPGRGERDRSTSRPPHVAPPKRPGIAAASTAQTGAHAHPAKPAERAPAARPQGQSPASAPAPAAPGKNGTTARPGRAARTARPSRNAERGEPGKHADAVRSSQAADAATSPQPADAVRPSQAADPVKPPQLADPGASAVFRGSGTAPTEPPHAAEATPDALQQTPASPQAVRRPVA